MKKLLYIIFGMLIAISATTYAANLQPSFVPSLIPVTTDKYYLGSTTPALEWLGIFTKDATISNLSGLGTKSVCVTNAGLLSVTGCPAGSGGGGAGTFATTTSTANGILINYPLNSTDVVTIGGSATNTSPFFFDPNTNQALIGNKLTSSTTIMGLFHLNLSNGGLGIANGLVYSGATTTAGTGLTYSGNAFNCNTASGSVFGCLPSASFSKFNSPTTTFTGPLNYSFVTNAVTLDTSGTWSGNAGTATALAANPTNCSAGNYPLGIDASGNVENCTAAGSGGAAFPFDTFPTFNATGTPIVFNAGLVSNSSTTINSNLFLPTLTAGSLYTTTNGRVATKATSTPTVTAPITYSGTLGDFVGGSSGAFACATCSTFGFPFSTTATYNSTSTAIGFLNGLFSTASSTFNNALQIPVSTSPSLTVLGGLAINTTQASTSVSFYDGTAQRNLYPTYDKSFNFASSSIAYDGVTASASSTLYLMANSYRSTNLISVYCKTKSGTVYMGYGNGTATSTVNCSTTGASASPNISFTMRQDQFMQFGFLSGTLGDVTVTATFINN